MSTVLSKQCTAVHNWFRGEPGSETMEKMSTRAPTSTSHGSVHVRLMVLAVEPAGGAGSITSQIQTYAGTGNTEEPSKRKLIQVEVISSPDKRIHARIRSINPVEEISDLDSMINCAESYAVIFLLRYWPNPPGIARRCPARSADARGTQTTSTAKYNSCCSLDRRTMY